MNRREFLRVMGIGAGTMLAQNLVSGCAVDPVTGRQVMVMMSEAEEISLDRSQSPHQFSSDYGVV
ncbi:MAG: peptidase M48 Ste24p, partial [Desulfobulbaceae bacterium]|nr:peptidase M48 Ste24p [Desulfobulbaceae bacterium]